MSPPPSIHLALAGAAGAFAAAGAGNQDVVVEQRGQQGFVGGVVMDLYRHR
jgi:hypothetical protein